MAFSSFSGIKPINNLLLIAWATAINDASFVRCATYGIAHVYILAYPHPFQMSVVYPCV